MSNIKKKCVTDTPDNSIPHKNGDLSTFSKFLAIFTMKPETYSIITFTEKQECDFISNWDEMTKYLVEENSRPNSISNKVLEYTIDSTVGDKFTKSLGLDIKVSLFKKSEEDQIRGCITSIENENEFNDWFVYHILSNTNVDKDNIKKVGQDDEKYHEVFTEYFVDNIKNSVSDEKWDCGGKEYFMERARYYTDRRIPIEAVLPAFPCKSSNFDKVNGVEPDKGEELALRRIIKFVEDVKEIYPPGMKVWIISDGHVFSDCIGVDDAVVDNYTDKLHELYQTITGGKDDYIQFHGLNEIFFGDSNTINLFDKNWTSDVTIEHLTGTKINEKADLSREVLMKGCDTDDGRLREHINTDGHPRLYLYRGFSKFMSEDLQLLPEFKQMSKKKFKKTISKIAFNMIRRNDAYSNLVELMFPHHLRFSIHAHNNLGPKYGIKVIASDECAVIKNLQDQAEPIFEDLLHIPTPWHNCVVTFDDSWNVINESEFDAKLNLFDNYTEINKVSSSSNGSVDSNDESTTESTSAPSIYSDSSDSKSSISIDTPLSTTSSLQTNKKKPLFYLTRSREVKEAIDKGLYNGEWRNTSIEDGIGGYYILSKRY